MNVTMPVPVDLARERGERVKNLAVCVVGKLDAVGLLRGTRDDAIVEIFHVLAEDLYSGQPVDIPTLRARRRA